jgi:16S rRNA (guanine527-N7)-methyltransferase
MDHIPSPQADNPNADIPNADKQGADTSSAVPIMNLLRQGCRQVGIPLSHYQVDQFEDYFHELVTWNQKMNLTAITDYDDVQVKHFLDSLAALPLIAEEVGDPDPGSFITSRTLHTVDVGTGAGFPGVPLRIIAPQLKLTLIDGTGKKIQFLNNLKETLGLTQVEVIQGRAEELGRDTAFRGQFDLVTARAVAPLNTLVEYLLPLTRRKGLVVIYKGSSAAQEFIDARQAIETLGGETVRFAPVQVPFMTEQRHILLIKKVRLTPNLYPRSRGMARKQPL